MQLTQALVQSPCAEAIVNGSSILIERFTDEPFACQCFTYDVYPAGHDRYNKMIYGDAGDVLSDIYENDDYAVFEDGQLEQADWQPTGKRIDLTGCTCRYCYDICISYHILPNGLAWHQAAWYTFLWWLQSLRWHLQIRWYLMHDRAQLKQALRRLDGEPEE